MVRLRVQMLLSQNGNEFIKYTFKNSYIKK